MNLTRYLNNNVDTRRASKEHLREFDYLYFTNRSIIKKINADKIARLITTYVIKRAENDSEH